MAEIGSQWRPSNSSDGIFMENICCFCERDQAFQAGRADGCEIAAAMYRDAGNSAWIIGLDGLPFCKSFKREGSAYRCPLTRDMFR